MSQDLLLHLQHQFSLVEKGQKKGQVPLNTNKYKIYLRLPIPIPILQTSSTTTTTITSSWISFLSAVQPEGRTGELIEDNQTE